MKIYKYVTQTWRGGVGKLGKVGPHAGHGAGGEPVQLGPVAVVQVKLKVKGHMEFNVLASGQMN